MTFPAGGNSTAGSSGAGSTAAPPPVDTTNATPSPAASGDEGAGTTSADETAKIGADGGKTSAAPPPKIERPASFREALDRERASASEGADTTEEKQAQKKPAQAAKPADAPTPKPDDTAKTAPAKADAAKPATETPSKSDAGTTAADAATSAAKPDAVKTAEADTATDAPTDEELVEAAGAENKEAFKQRFKDASDSAVDFAYRQARKNRELAPIAELVESVGGMDGAKLAFDYTKELTALARPVATAEEKLTQVNKFREFLYKTAPAAASALESTLFWQAVDDTPAGHENLQGLLDEVYGDGVITLEQSRILHNAFADGRIDIDELADGDVDYRLTRAQREAAARQSKRESKEVESLRARVAELEGNGKTADDAKEETRVTKVKEAMTSFVRGNYELVAPILREYGLSLPDDTNSPAFKSMQRRIRHIQRDLEDQMAQDEDYRAVVGNINNLQTEGVHSIQLGTARNKMRVALRQILDEYAPEAAEEIKRKNKLVADRVKKNGSTATTVTPARPRNTPAAEAPSNSERAISAEEKRAGIKRLIDEGRAAAQTGT